MKLSFLVHPTCDGFSLSDYLKDELLIPRKVRHFLRIRKNVKINGLVEPFHTLLKSGDCIELQFLKEDYPIPQVIPNEKIKPTILFEDEHLIVVDKPQGMKTHPNEPTEKDTLLNSVAGYLKEKKQLPYVVHRLDKETSGLVLFAKDPIILPILGRMLERKEIHRLYQAEVIGKVTPMDFDISKPIGRDRHDRRKRIIDEKNGQKALTHVHVVESDNQKSQLELVLETGRTHQIRVHLAYIGHPIIGDPLYGKGGSQEKMALRAVSLSFKHPLTGELLSIESPYLLFKKR